jgi:hypothetical protein
MAAERKRQKVTDTLDLVSSTQIDDVESPHTLQAYLANLQTLLLAYARAGCIKLEKAPASESISSDSTEFVEVPLDICMAYLCKIQKVATEIATGNALEWIRVRDEQERIMWVEDHRSSERTLGQVMKKAADLRLAVWQVPIELKKPDPRAATGSGSGGGGGGEAGFPAAPTLEPGTLARRMRNGDLICPDYNHKGCSEPCKRTPKELHVCGCVQKNQRICGMKNHKFKDCKHRR